MLKSKRGPIVKINSSLTAAVLAAICLLFAAPLAARAATFTYINVPGAEQDITSVAFDGFAGLFEGARATVFFSDGASDSALFSFSSSGLDESAIAHVANSFLVGVFSSGTVVSSPSFQVTNLGPSGSRSVSGFRIDGLGDGAGHAAFDRGIGLTDTTTPSTPDSSGGRDLFSDLTNFPLSQSGGEITVTYSNPLALNGAAPVGDLYRTIEVQFALTGAFVASGLPPGFSFSTFNFTADVDAVTYAAVPEPTTALLMACGLAALAGRRKT